MNGKKLIFASCLSLACVSIQARGLSNILKEKIQTVVAKVKDARHGIKKSVQVVLASTASWWCGDKAFDNLAALKTRLYKARTNEGDDFNMELIGKAAIPFVAAFMVLGYESNNLTPRDEDDKA